MGYEPYVQYTRARKNQRRAPFDIWLKPAFSWVNHAQHARAEFSLRSTQRSRIGDSPCGPSKCVYAGRLYTGIATSPAMLSYLALWIVRSFFARFDPAMDLAWRPTAELMFEAF